MAGIDVLDADEPRHAGLAGKLAQCFAEGQPFLTHHEIEAAAVCATAKAVEGPGVWINRERGCAVVVEGAATDITTP